MATGIWAEQIFARVVAPTPSSFCLASLPSLDEFACAARADPTSHCDATTFPSSSLSLPLPSSWRCVPRKGAGLVSSFHGQVIPSLWQRRSHMGGHGGVSGAAAAAGGGNDHGLQLGMDVGGAGRAATSHYHYSLQRRRYSTRRAMDNGEDSNTGSNGNKNRRSEEGLSGGKDGTEAMDEWSVLAAEDEEDDDEKIEKENEDGENVARKNVTNEKRASWSWRGWWASSKVPREEELIQEMEGEVEEKERGEEGEVEREDVERAGGDPEIVAAAAAAESEEGDVDGLEEKEEEEEEEEEEDDEASIRRSKLKGVQKKGEEASVGFWRRVLFWKQSVESDEKEELEPDDELLLQDLESLSFSWKEIFDPTWENLLALGFTALLAVAVFKIFMQLFAVVLTILLEALKYTVLASIVVGLLIFFL